MADRQLAGSLQLRGDWDLGEDNWKDAMDGNLLKLSTLGMPIAISMVSATPGSPAEGDVYIFDETHPTQANAIAVYDEATWVYYAPVEGWMCYDTAGTVLRQFDGAEWIEFTSGGGGGGGAWMLSFKPRDNEPPSTNFATIDFRNYHPVLDFDTTTQEAAIFTGVLPYDYAGAGLSITIVCAMSTAVSGTVGWDIAIERIDASSLDIDTDSFATAHVIAAVAVPTTSGQVLYMTGTLSNGSDMDNLAAGELFRLRVRRDVANDTATGDAELLAVTIKEQ